MARPSSKPSVNTGVEMLDDSITQADIDSLAVETITNSDDNANDSTDNESESKTRERWRGGYNVIFSSQPDCENHPVTKEDGSAPEEKDQKLFKIFVVKFRAYLSAADNDPDNMSIVYVWARNTLEATNIVATLKFEFQANQFGATRGRRKLFKPDENIVKLAKLYKGMNDPKTIAGFLESLPDYRYIFDNSEQPEFATVKKVLLSRVEHDYGHEVA